MDFVCKDRQQCLFHSMVCDGVVQCRDGSDEDTAFAGCCEWGGVPRRNRQGLRGLRGEAPPLGHRLGGVFSLACSEKDLYFLRQK